MPTDVDLWDATDAELRVADEAWAGVESRHGAGYVRAGKLLARKRPRLIPVWDSVVKDFFDTPGAVWASFRHCLADDDRRQSLAALLPPSWPQEMSLLRFIDVAAWMHRR